MRKIRNKKTGEVRIQYRTGYDIESNSYPFLPLNDKWEIVK